MAEWQTRRKMKDNAWSLKSRLVEYLPFKKCSGLSTQPVQVRFLPPLHDPESGLYARFWYGPTLSEASDLSQSGKSWHFLNRTMPRIRTIKPEFWESESVACLSFGARLMFLASLNLADDDGLLRWNTSYLSAHAFMYDDIDPKTIDKWMKELETNGFIFPYKAGKTLQSLGWIVKFTKHQVINRPQPSKLPPPSIQSSKVKALYFERDGMICHICKGEIDLMAPLKEVGSKAGSLDHLKPVSKGGTDHPSNILSAHISCNIKKGAKFSEIVSDESDINSLNDSVNDSVNDSLLEREEERKGKGGGVGESRKCAYYIGGKGFDLLYDFLCLRFPKVIESLKTDYPDPVYSKALEEFSKRNLQKEWKDESDFKNHLYDSFRTFEKLNGESLRKQAKAAPTRKNVNDLLNPDFLPSNGRHN